MGRFSMKSLVSLYQEHNGEIHSGSTFQRQILEDGWSKILKRKLMLFDSVHFGWFFASEFQTVRMGVEFVKRVFKPTSVLSTSYESFWLARSFR